jgi:hypothetical protein
MVRASSASSRNSSGTERGSPNATDPYARDASARRRLLDGIRPAFGAGGIEPPTCLGNRAKLALRKSRVVARMHAPIVRWSAIRGKPLPRRQPSPDTSSK